MPEARRSTLPPDVVAFCAVLARTYRRIWLEQAQADREQHQ